MGDSDIDYPVTDGDHTVKRSVAAGGDRFWCHHGDATAYDTTGSWPAWNHCPFCGEALPDMDGWESKED